MWGFNMKRSVLLFVVGMLLTGCSVGIGRVPPIRPVQSSTALDTLLMGTEALRLESYQREMDRQVRSLRNRTDVLTVVAVSLVSYVVISRLKARADLLDARAAINAIQ